MLIDLFSNKKILNSMNTKDNQITTRNFKLLDKTELTNLKGIGPDFLEYKNRLLSLSEKEREYERIGYAKCDNLFELELLGIGEYCMPYTLVLDFSDSLDYVLHRLCGCSMEAIRSIDNYEKISKALCAHKFEGVADVLFGSLMDVDAKLDEFLEEIETSVVSTYSSVTEEELLEKFIIAFINRIAEVCNSIKIYSMLSIKEQSDFSIVVRSSSYSAILATSEKPLETEVIIKDSNYSDCTLKLKCYRKLEYAVEKGAVLEYSR